MATRLLAIGLALALTACGGMQPDEPGPEAAATDGTRPAGLSEGRHVWTTADGIEVPYEVHGSGDVTVVLVHCWMCERTFWSEQVPVLADRYRTIALDLPGHGEAGDDRERWTVAAYGEDVAGFLRALDLTGVVLVGHSMGGPVSLRAAALTDDRVRGIVAVDTLHDAEFDFSGERVEQFMKAWEADYVATCNGFIDQMFPEDGAERVMERVRRTSCETDNAPVGVPLMRSFSAIDMETWFSEAGVPIRAINATEPNPTMTDVNRKYADFDAVLMEDVGHYPHMTRPERFNELLLEAIERILSETA